MSQRSTKRIDGVISATVGNDWITLNFESHQITIDKLKIYNGPKENVVVELTKEREANKRKDEQRYRISDLEAELMKSHDSISEIYSAWDSERLDYADQITMLEQVLKWYADKQNWKARNRCGNCGHHFENDYDSAEWDEGARARAILEGNEPNEGNKAT
jgi:hypothetical protein